MKGSAVVSDSATPEFSQAGNVFEQPGSIELATADATREFGAQLGATLAAGDVVILSGGLGAGKTTLTQGIAKGMDVRGRVTSPTFTIARVHRARRADAPDLVHVDAYRLLGESAADPWGELMHSILILIWTPPSSSRNGVQAWWKR